MTNINSLGVYCIECGLTQDFYKLESIKIPKNPQYKRIFECSNCSGNEFQIYSTTSY